MPQTNTCLALQCMQEGLRKVAEMYRAMDEMAAVLVHEAGALARWHMNLLMHEDGIWLDSRWRPRPDHEALSLSLTQSHTLPVYKELCMLPLPPLLPRLAKWSHSISFTIFKWEHTSRVPVAIPVRHVHTDAFLATVVCRNPADHPCSILHDLQMGAFVTSPCQEHHFILGACFVPCRIRLINHTAFQPVLSIVAGTLAGALEGTDK
eukprot:1161715-Pelagomonas_calceolata.AAC.3